MSSNIFEIINYISDYISGSYNSIYQLYQVVTVLEGGRSVERVCDVKWLHLNCYASEGEPIQHLFGFSREVNQIWGVRSGNDLRILSGQLV